MSVVALQPPSAIYREEQYFAWWLYALLAVMVVLGVLSVASPHGVALPGGAAAVPRARLPLPLLVGLVLPPVLVVGVLRMTTEVTLSACRIWFGIVPTYRRELQLDEIRRVEIVRYHAIRDHGFWGVRTTRDGERICTARGSRAVRVHLADGSRVLIGTQRPEELAAVLDRAARPVG